MLSIKNLKIHPLVPLQVDPDPPHVLVPFSLVADLLRVAAVSPVAVEALAVVGAAGVGKSSIHFCNIESRMSYIHVLWVITFKTSRLILNGHR